jgi:uncharacterized membrane protein YhdT
MYFQDAVAQLYDLGFLDVVLPFILIFAVVFAALRTTKILGDEKRIHAIIALVMGMTVVIPHALGLYPEGMDAVTIINTALPNVSIVLIAVLMVLVILGMFGTNVSLASSSLGGWVLIASVIIVAVIFGSSAGWFGLPNWLSFMNDSATRSIVIIILIFGIIIAFITGGDRQTEGKRGLGKLMEDWGKSLGGPK